MKNWTDEDNRSHAGKMRKAWKKKEIRNKWYFSGFKLTYMRKEKKLQRLYYVHWI